MNEKMEELVKKMYEEDPADLFDSFQKGKTKLQDEFEYSQPMMTSGPSDISNRPDIDNSFVREFAENLSVFCDFEKRYLEKNSEYDILLNEDSFLKDYYKQKREREVREWTKSDDWIQDLRREIGPNPNYTMEV